MSTISAGRDALTHEDEMQNAVSISLKREICKHLETLQKVLQVILSWWHQSSTVGYQSFSFWYKVYLDGDLAKEEFISVKMKNQTTTFV